MRCESCGKALASGAYRTPPSIEHATAPPPDVDSAPTGSAIRRGLRVTLLALFIVVVATAVSFVEAVMR